MQFVLKNFALQVENYPIDESFLYLKNLKYIDLMELALKIRQTLGQFIGVPVVVGIAPSKTLAKLANRYVKKEHREKGVYALDSDSGIEGVLKWAGVGDVWGVVRQYEKSWLTWVCSQLMTYQLLMKSGCGRTCRW